MRAEFFHDLKDDFLKIAQLFDPRVSHRARTADEIERLLALAFTTFKPPQAATVGIDEDDIFGAAIANPNDHSAEVAAFKLAMRKTKTKVRNENGEVTTEYFGGVERQQDIDVFSFYRAVKDTFPTLEVIIRKVLSNLAATATNERSFNIAGNILNLRRCRLDPKRAEKLILSAFRYKVNLAAGRKPPRLPSFCVIEKDDSYDDLEMEEALQDEEDAAGWEAFFDDEDNDV